jgi:hypothetical protein
MVEHRRQVAAECRDRTRVDEARRPGARSHLREQQLHAFVVDAHAEVEIRLGRAAHHGREMEHRVGVRRADTRDGPGVGDVTGDRFYFLQFLGTRRKCAVQQGDAGDGLAAQLPAREQRFGEFEAEEPAAAGDEDFHAGILAKNSTTSSIARVCFIGGRLARTVRP